MRLHGPESRAREALANGAQLAGLSALAVAQPVFDILGRNPAFFAVRASPPAEIVLFAVGLALLPALVLVLLELAVSAVSRTAARAVHVVFVGGLVALLALLLVTKTEALSGAAALAAAAVAGAAGAAVYLLVVPARSFLTVLGPVPLVFLGLFLLHSPVSDLVLVEEAEAQAAAPVAGQTPVVLVVFDELATVSLLDENEEIDAERYPNFAALAREATWFRNATTVYWTSEVAVPSILTGLLPDPEKLPVHAEYPQNLFTLLGGSYDVRAVETLTSLCPPELCGDGPEAETRAVSGGLRSLVSDTGVVYLHLVLPEPYVGRVPSIEDTWGDFGRAPAAEEAALAADGAAACPRNVCHIADLVRAGDPERTLYFGHSLLPHVPYVYLPSGRRYVVDARPLRGLRNGMWQGEWPARLGQQRYLLQLAYTDRALGRIVRRLRDTGVYDRALVIVTADHGVSFRVGSQRRLAQRDNLDDIAFVPLFVKLPRQDAGRVDDSLATTIDIVPTIASVLGAELPWPVDGRPLVGERPLPADGTVAVVKQDGSRVTAPLSELRAKRRETLARQVERFGTGPLERVFRAGPHAELVGRRVAELPVQAAAGARVELPAAAFLDAVDPGSGFLPALVEGRLVGRTETEPLALAVNGTIAATASTFKLSDEGAPQVAAILPEEAFRRGANTLEVFAIREEGPGLVLEQLAGAQQALALRSRGGREVVETPAGGTIPVREGVLEGTVEVEARRGAFLFAGSAVDAAADDRAYSIAVFVGGRAVYRGFAATLRPHRILGEHDLGEHGFAFELPRSLLPAPGRGERVRVLAFSREGVASELRPVGEYPWRR